MLTVSIIRWIYTTLIQDYRLFTSYLCLYSLSHSEQSRSIFILSSVIGVVAVMSVLRCPPRNRDHSIQSSFECDEREKKLGNLIKRVVKMKMKMFKFTFNLAINCFVWDVIRRVANDISSFHIPWCSLIVCINRANGIWSVHSKIEPKILSSIYIHTRNYRFAR